LSKDLDFEDDFIPLRKGKYALSGMGQPNKTFIFKAPLYY